MTIDENGNMQEEQDHKGVTEFMEKMDKSIGEIKEKKEETKSKAEVSSTEESEKQETSESEEVVSTEDDDIVSPETDEENEEEQSEDIINVIVDKRDDLVEDISDPDINTFLLYMKHDDLEKLILNLDNTPEIRKSSRKELYEPGSRVFTMGFMYRNPDAETEDTHSRIDLIKANKEEFSRVLKDDKDKTILGTSRREQKLEGELFGRDAVQAFKGSENKNFGKRIPLYNSGFCIELEEPTNAQLSQYTSQILPELDENGRQMGVLYYMFMDYHLKDGAARLIRELTVDASFDEWDRGNNLLDALSIEDMDVVLMHIASLMFPDGFDKFEHVCRRPDGSCKHVINETVDLSRMIYTNFTRLPQNARDFMRRSIHRKGIITLEDLSTYRDMIKFTTNSENNEIKWRQYGFILKSPLYTEYRDSGARYLSLINQVIFTPEEEDSFLTKQKMAQAISYRMLRQLSPWIQELRNYNKDGGFIRTTDEESIDEIMDYIQTIDQEDEVYPLFAEALNRHKLSHICYPVLPCPKCGYPQPEDLDENDSGYLTINPIQTFFTMCVNRSQRLI